MYEEEDYLDLMRSLNDMQQRLVTEVWYRIKAEDEQFFIFLSGGAGVGKSHVIKAIVQSILRIRRALPTEHPDEIYVLVVAPTGKAAFNVRGMTIHSAFHIFLNQNGNLMDLNPSTANTLRLKLLNVQLIIIDEISMVSNQMLFWVNQRLQQLFNTTQDFGGKSLLVVGDFRQLPPVGGSYVFVPPTFHALGNLAGAYLWESFQFFQLHEIMRQRGEFEFCKALNNMAVGGMDENDIALMRSCEVSATHKPPDDTIRLFYTNKECQDFNEQVHSLLNTDFVISTAVDFTKGNQPYFRLN